MSMTVEELQLGLLLVSIALTCVQLLLVMVSHEVRALKRRVDSLTDILSCKVAKLEGDGA